MSDMRAVVITAPGGPEVLEIQSRPIPEPGLNHIRVRVHSSALNRADISQRLGRYPAPPGVAPDISGLEYAGEVDTLGPDARMWEVGTRVMGIVGGGAHAEYLCVHEREVMPIPIELTWEEAAAIPEVFLTAYDAMFRQLHMRMGERFLIHAVGSGVGTAAVQLARVAGLNSIGTSRTPDKLRRAGELGLTAGIHASADWPEKVLANTQGAGVHAILDLVGGGYLSGNLNVLAQRGRMISVGLTAGRSAELDMSALMRKRIHIMGTTLRARPIEEKITLVRDFADRVLPFFSSRRLKPVLDSVHSFNDIRDAHVLMESDSSFGKIILRWD
ncbi:MAG: NAD(P)H-quinone oxidoreductase [Gemmatimonadales bacterium]